MISLSVTYHLLNYIDNGSPVIRPVEDFKSTRAVSIGVGAFGGSFVTSPYKNLLVWGSGNQGNFL